MAKNTLPSFCSLLSSPLPTPKFKSKQQPLPKTLYKPVQSIQKFHTQSYSAPLASSHFKAKNMTPMLSFLLFSFLSLLSIGRAQDRAPHGLAYENPMALSPSAFEFFHPNTQQPTTNNNPCAASNCSPLPLAAQVEATLAHESRSTPQTGGGGVGAAGIAGIVFGFAFAVLLAMGVYYVVITRRVNTSRGTSVQPDV